jgi:OmpA-OmpF porin, OOP family
MKFTLLIMLATLAACSTKPPVQNFPDTASATEELRKFNEDLAAAKKNQVDVLSPENFKDAEDSYTDAKHEKDEKDILKEVALGKAYLEEANKFSDLARTNLKEVVTARQAALDANGMTFVKKDFKEADEDLTDVTSDIEDNKLDSADKKKTALQLTYLDLELRAIKKDKLGAAQSNVDKATREGAKEFAPRTLAVAQKTIQDSDAFITANRHDTAMVNANAQKATESSEHLLKITRNAKSGDKTSPEDMALSMESEQNKVAASRTMIASKNELIASKNGQIASERNAVNALAAENAALGSEQAFNQKFEETRKEFDPSEAEVYKQGDVLVIRLRSLNFSESRASLQASNFPLLAKVNKAIQGFGTSSVVIEGHTDSNGGKALNTKLSAERANAVRQYLLSSFDYQPADLTAVGYGYEKPLASNKTSEGRAQNRRVDILIHPTSETKL